MHQNRRDTLRCSGRVSANPGELWRIVFASAAKLTVPLTVAVHARKKPFVYTGFDNLNTDGHGWTRIRPLASRKLKAEPPRSVKILDCGGRAQRRHRFRMAVTPAKAAWRCALPPQSKKV